MSNGTDHESRAREIADTTRRLLVGINTGGIGAAFAMAGSLATHKVNPAWAAWPAAFFIAGLVTTGVSLLLAKHRELKRRDAVEAGKQPPDFTALFWRSFTWDALALLLFVAGCVAGLWRLGCIQV